MSVTGYRASATGRVYESWTEAALDVIENGGEVEVVERAAGAGEVGK